MIYKKILIFSFILLTYSNTFSLSLFYDRVEIVSSLVKDFNTLHIQKYQIVKPSSNKIFLEYYWKIYYKNKKIVGEELYKKGALSYFYIYYYYKNKIYQKGFFWYGVNRDIVHFKVHEKLLKQGWFYKYIPHSYRVFNSKTLKILYSYYFTNNEI